MSSIFQRISESFSVRKNTSAIIVAGLSAALMTLVDSVFLTGEASMLRGVSLGFTAVLKLAIAATFGGMFATMFPIRRYDNTDPDRVLTNAIVKETPFRLLQQGGMFVLVSSVATIAGATLFGQTHQFSADALMRFVSSIAALIFVAVVVRQLQWLDALIQIRRTTFTARFRIIAMVVAAALVVMQVFSVVTAIDTTMILGFLLAGLGMLLFIATARISWISSFSKDQKWKAFGISFITLIASVWLSSSLESSNQVIGFLEKLLPGARNFAMFSSILSALFFLRISFSIGIALPTAAIVDRKINEVRSLAYLSRTISQVYDLERLLGIVTTMIRDVCGATSSWVELEDSETRTMSIAAQLKISQQELQVLYKDGILRTMLAQQGGQALHFEALDEEPLFAPIYPYTSDFAQSMIAVPLMLDNRRIGTLFAAHRDKFIFELEDISLLSAFANNISIAIENVRLFENSLEQERFKREMILAREMQHKLLPKQLPKIEGFDIAAYSSPALEVGGDYYDCVKLSNGLDCVIIGDVSGKGITAAFYMAELKGVVLAVAPESTSPKDLLCRINSALKGSIEKGAYIAMTAVSLCPESQEIVIARAGHTPIAIASGGTIELHTPKGIGVALVDRPMFESSLLEMRVKVAKDDICLLFTDGVNEAVNAEQEEFGTAPLHLVLEQKNPEARFIVGEIVRRVSEFSEGLPQHDDLTIIAIVAQPSFHAPAKPLPTNVQRPLPESMLQ
jgi:sigma-B regulation protein RsbU (phosphoserine phosphatase)